VECPEHTTSVVSLVDFVSIEFDLVIGIDPLTGDAEPHLCVAMFSQTLMHIAEHASNVFLAVS